MRPARILRYPVGHGERRRTAIRRRRGPFGACGPLESRFLFVDVVGAASEAAPARRAAAIAGAAVAAARDAPKPDYGHKLERLAMDEVRQRLHRLHAAGDAGPRGGGVRDRGRTLVPDQDARHRIYSRGSRRRRCFCWCSSSASASCSASRSCAPAEPQVARRPKPRRGRRRTADDVPAARFPAGAGRPAPHPGTRRGGRA